VADEPFRVGGEGGGEHVRPGGLDGLGAAIVDIGGGVQAQRRMAMLVVVPGEEDLAVCPGGLDRGEAAGEVRPVLQRLELGL
jgi:hypothetical protein